LYVSSDFRGAADAGSVFGTAFGADVGSGFSPRRAVSAFYTQIN